MYLLNFFHWLLLTDTKGSSVPDSTAFPSCLTSYLHCLLDRSLKNVHPCPLLLVLCSTFFGVRNRIKKSRQAASTIVLLQRNFITSPRVSLSINPHEKNAHFLFLVG